MRYRSVIYVRWHVTGRFEIFINLGKLYSIYSDSELGVSRNTLAKKDLYSGYHNSTVEIFKCVVR
jgi:hypothetical protein